MLGIFGKRREKKSPNPQPQPQEQPRSEPQPQEQPRSEPQPQVQPGLQPLPQQTLQLQLVQQPQSEQQKASGNTLTGWKMAAPYLLAVFTLIAGICIDRAFGLPVQVAKMETRAEERENARAEHENEQEKRLKSLEDDLKEASEKLDTLSDNFSSLKDRLEYFFPAAFIIPLSDAGLPANITHTFYSRDNATVKSLPAISMSYTDPIAHDVKTGIPYTVQDLVDEKLLVPYKNGEEDMFFYGKFNEKGNWDGHCIINVYKNGSLELIVDAEYDDGTLLHSKQVFHYVTIYSKIKQDVWAISDRTVENGYSSGDTNLYYRNGDFSQRFAPDSMKEGDIISADQFYNMMDLELYAYYYGNTSDGYFNDSTGNAYLIYYNKENKTVKTLYGGKFVNGTMNDSTGNAWWITEDDETPNGRYGYYKGPFANGDAVYKRRYEYNISQDRIDEILKETGKDSLGLIWRQVGENKM